MDTVCCVYKIQHKLDFDGEDFYIGSTKNFHRRKGEHKFKCKDSNIPLYKYIRDNGGFYNFEITILENVDNEDDLLLKERFYIESLNPTLNTNIPLKTDEEHKEYSKKYWETHKEKFNIRVICECGSESSKQNLPRHRKSKTHLNKMKLV
tara:strand:+ start:43 stop:492 length:450 start_codon:yes stop_codon:yes gene_type:complete